MAIHAHDYDLSDRAVQKVLYLQPDRHNDIDRIDDIGADAIRAARAAMEHLDALSDDDLRPIARHLKTLAAAVEKRRVLNEDFRHAAEVILRDLARTEPQDPLDSHLWQATKELRDALDASHRVADLLAAERDVMWHRANAR